MRVEPLIPDAGPAPLEPAGVSGDAGAFAQALDALGAALEGAGGAVVDLAGNALRYGKPEILNPSFIATRDLALIPR